MKFHLGFNHNSRSGVLYKTFTLIIFMIERCVSLKCIIDINKIEIQYVWTELFLYLGLCSGRIHPQAYIYQWVLWPNAFIENQVVTFCPKIGV